MFYTYVWHEGDGKPFYVGKGCGNRYTSLHGRKEDFLAKARAEGSYVRIDDVFIHESQALAREMHLISTLGRKDLKEGPLLNKTNGGEATPEYNEIDRANSLSKAIERAVELYRIEKPEFNVENLNMLRLERVLDLIPVSKVHIYRMIKAKEFPAPIKVGNVSLWSNQEIREWKRRRLAAPRMLVETLLDRKRKREREDLA